MRKLLLFVLIGCFLASAAYAVVDTRDGAAITAATDQDGFSSNLDDVDGQEITAGGGGSTYDTGDIFSERFGTTGSDGYDNGTPDGGYEEGTITEDPDDQTALGATGFEGDHFSLTASAGSTDSEMFELPSAQNAVYGRFYYYVDAESWGNSESEGILSITDAGGTIGDADLISFYLNTDASGNLYLKCKFVGEASWSTGDGDSDTISLDTSYKIEFEYTDTQVTWWVDGVQQGQRTGLSGNPDATEILFGIGYNGNASVTRLDTIDLDSSGRLNDS